MSQSAGSSGKVAALIGLTMLVGGAEISSAATIIQSQHFGPLPGPSSVTAVPLTFNLFNPSNGILTGVDFNLTGQIAETIGVTNVTATIDIPILGGSLGISPASPITVSPIAVNATNTDTGNSVLKYIGTGTFEASFAYSALCGLGTPFSCGPGFSGDVTFTYTYTPAAVPLPAALPLFATGLGALALLGWRRKRKLSVTD